MGGVLSQRYEINTRIDGKTVLITGAATGIGKYTTQELYKVGGRVIMACVDISEAEQAAEEIRKNVSSSDPENQGGELVIKKIDLASMESIRSFACDIIESEKQINILINNAGVMVQEYETTDDGFEKHFGTNYLGHFYLTYLLLPKILRSTPARIIGVASSAYASGHIHWDDLNLEKNYSWWTAYAQSKLAVVLFIRELAHRLEGTRVSTYSVHPGPTITNIYRGMYRNYAGLKALVTATALKVNKIYRILNTVEEGAATKLYCALDESLVDESGFYYVACSRTELAEHARNDQNARRLWNESLKILGLQDLDINKNQGDN